MMEKWKQKAVGMNFKKAVITFLVTGFLLVVAASAALYGNFGNRISEWEQIKETDKEYEKNFKERKEKDLEEVYDRLQLSMGDIVLFAGCIVVIIVLGIWYWLLVMAWVYRKAYHMGVNCGLAVFAALFFNLAAVAVLYLYAMLKGTCANCGRVRKLNWKFCDRCGTSLKKECPQCRQETDISSVYCSNCGRKLDENKEKSE